MFASKLRIEHATQMLHYNSKTVQSGTLRDRSVMQQQRDGPRRHAGYRSVVNNSETVRVWYSGDRSVISSETVEGASTAQPDQLALGIALFEDRSALYFTLRECC